MLSDEIGKMGGGGDRNNAIDMPFNVSIALYSYFILLPAIFFYFPFIFLPV